jgi:hypothetical protein
MLPYYEKTTWRKKIKNGLLIFSPFYLLVLNLSHISLPCQSRLKQTKTYHVFLLKFNYKEIINYHKIFVPVL